MAVVDIRRPAATSSSSSLTVTGAASAHAALSDQSDASYINASGVGLGEWFGTMAAHALPADHARHRIRATARMTPYTGTGPDWGTVVSPFPYTTLVGSPLDTFADYSGSWGNAAVPFVFAASIDVAGTIRNTFTGGVWLHRVSELWVEIDSRAAPTFVLDVLDGDMVSADPIVLTNEPYVEIGSLALDGLPGRTWRIALYTLAQTTAGGFAPFVTTPVWQPSGTGTPPATAQTDPLPNDDYVVYAQVVSTVAADTAHPSDIESYGFEVAVPAPPPPDVTVTVTDQTARICVDQGTPGEGDTEWDDTWSVRIRRVDCANPAPGLLIHVSEQVNEEYCFDDCYAPTTVEGCDPEDECPVTYSVTLRGLVGGYELTSAPTVEGPMLIPSAGTDRLIDIGCHETVFCTVDKSWTRVRPSQAWQAAVGGYPTVTAGSPGGRNWRLNIGVAKSDLLALEAILSDVVVFYSPSHGPGEWLAPVSETGVVETLNGYTYSVDTVAVPPPV